MTNLINRIKTLEKITKPTPVRTKKELVISVWDKNGKNYYRDKTGKEAEFIAKDHKNTKLVINLTRGEATN